MRVIHVKTGKELHVAREDWVEVALLEGILKVAPAEAPAPRVPKSSWVVTRGAQDPLAGELRVRVECASCSNSLTIFKATDKSSFGHCGIVERVPADVLARYEKLVEATTPKKKKRTLPPGTVFHVEL
jgi:hypothetical protein